jgi:hypothetical protein
MLIGVTGKAGSGKDAFAKYFIDQQRFAKYALADPIKRMIEAGFNIGPAAWEDRAVKEKEIEWLGRSLRYLAQTLGTEWGRMLVHPDIWLLLAEQRRLQVNNLIITDVRFDNEAEWMLSKGGTLFEIVRDAQEMDNAGHASEKGVSSSLIAHTVQNFGTISDLRRKARAAWGVLNRG